MVSFGSADNQVHIANQTNENIYVLAAPNPDWVWADVAINITLTVASLGLGYSTGISTLTALQRAGAAITAILSAASIGASLKHGILTEKSVIAAKKEADKIHKFLDRNALKIEPKQFKKVFETTNWNPQNYIGASGWGAVLGGSDCTLFIINQSLTRSAMFNTNSDHSWIVNTNEIMRSQYGTLWKEDAPSGYYRFNRGDRLLMGMYLNPCEAISSPNGNYDLVYHGGGNLMVVKRNRPNGDKMMWESKTMTFPRKLAWRTYMQDDGNLVVYESANKPLWASNTAGRGGCQLVMQDDGNLVVYTKENKPIWDIWNTAR